MIVRCIGTDTECFPVLKDALSSVTKDIENSAESVTGLFKACKDKADIIIVGDKPNPTFKSAIVKTLTNAAKYSTVGQSRYGLVIKNGSKQAAYVANKIINS
jgi:hypothetical protein